MIFAFKKLSGKVQTVLKTKIDVRLEPFTSPEVLRFPDKSKIQGCFSIINYLSKTRRTPLQNDRLWWLAFQLQELQQVKNADVSVPLISQGTFAKKKIIRTDNLKALNRTLEHSKFLEGDQVSEADVIAYVKLKQAMQDQKQQGKVAIWFKFVAALVDPILAKYADQFKAELAALAAKNQQAQQKAQEQLQQKQSQPKQPQPDPEKPKDKQPKKEKVQVQISPEYQAKFNALKIVRTNHGQQILPSKEKKNVLITSALPYVNNVPHLGNIIGCVLSADVFARYSRLRGYNTLFICGTDEYGTATEVKALQENMTPKQICDKYFQIHSDVYKWFDIDFDYFGRTSTQVHSEITHDIFNHLHPKYTTTKTKGQTYCENCQMFLADRYVTGECPQCKFVDARGDQCDDCQTLLDPEDLVNPLCVVCRKTPVVKDTTHIYINLPSIQDRLEEWINETAHKGQWSQNSLNISKGWIKMGLKERCITRDLKWGVQVPLAEFAKKVFYVWFDAPIGYLSITGNFIKEWQHWWKNPENVSLFQFMGKDNVPFHTVIFPSTLMGTGENYTLLNTISTTDYLNYEDGKFSKSRGIGVFGDNAVDSGIPCEIFRYYLLINRPEKADTVFTWDDFGVKNNNELLPNLGNLVNRTMKFIQANYSSTVPQVELKTLTKEDNEFIDSVANKFKNEYIAAFEKVELKEALKRAMELSSLVNKYLQDEKAWEKEQQATKRSDTVLFLAVNAIRLVSATVEPFMPSVAAKINFILGFNERTARDDAIFEHVLSQPFQESLTTLVAGGQKINSPIPLFRTFTPDELKKWRDMYSGQVKQQQQNQKQ